MTTTSSSDTSNMKTHKYHIVHKNGYCLEVVETHDEQETAFQHALRLQVSNFKSLAGNLYEKTMVQDPEQSHEWKLEQLRKAMSEFWTDTDLDVPELEYFYVMDESKHGLIDFKTSALDYFGSGRSEEESSTMAKYMYASLPLGEYQSHVFPTAPQKYAPPQKKGMRAWLRERAMKPRFYRRLRHVSC